MNYSWNLKLFTMKVENGKYYFLLFSLNRVFELLRACLTQIPLFVTLILALEQFWKETRHVAMGFELNNFVYIHSGLPIEVTKLKCRIRFCCCSEKKWRRTNEKMVDHLKNMRKFDFPIDRYDNDPYLKHPLLKMNKTKRKKRDKNQAKLVSKKSVTNQR